METQSTFRKYLADLGDGKASLLYGVKPRTVQSWRLGEKIPRPAMANVIVARSPLTLDDIYGASK
jgi:hypothetical protein